MAFVGVCCFFFRWLVLPICCSSCLFPLPRKRFGFDWVRGWWPGFFRWSISLGVTPWCGSLLRLNLSSWSFKRLEGCRSSYGARCKTRALKNECKKTLRSLLQISFEDIFDPWWWQSQKPHLDIQQGWKDLSWKINLILAVVFVTLSLVSFWLRDGELFDYPQGIWYLEGQKTSTDLCSQKQHHDSMTLTNLAVSARMSWFLRSSITEEH